WASLPEGATVATSSLRRRAQLLHLRPDLRIADIRGNVDTRLAKLEARSEWSAILLATAGLVRLGQAHRISERLDPEVMLPAPGQGALAVTARSDDPSAAGAVRTALHHAASAMAVAAERAFLRRLEGGCQVPVAAYAELRGAEGAPALHLRGRVVSLEGERASEGSADRRVGSEADADAMGVALAERLLGEGAAEILAAVRLAASPPIAEP
ncbi:MAG TPA: hydroxymethylbilane synthase, partial [Gemmatimonadales bacterium]|nr:hydroxymethylbilane synthase [Gemmatimonadales bacterium]